MTEEERIKYEEAGKRLEAERQQINRWKSEMASWKSTMVTEDELVSRFLDLIERGAKPVTRVQEALSRALETEDGNRLSTQLVWLDAQLATMGFLQSDADALLDLAEKFYLLPPGRSLPCTDANGNLIPDTKSRGKKPEDDDFTPKYHTITDTDRTVELKASCAPFRRLRDEYRIICEVIRNRLFLGQRILEELKARHRASGLSESSR